MSLADLLERHLLTCPSRALLHIDCPGCGMQRSFICLLRGDVSGSLALHPATIPMLALIIFAVLHLLFKFKKGGRVIVIFQLTVAIITLGFYIYKIAHHKIFC
jgi:hypothetical protein